MIKLFMIFIINNNNYILLRKHKDIPCNGSGMFILPNTPIQVVLVEEYFVYLPVRTGRMPPIGCKQKGTCLGIC